MIKQNKNLIFSENTYEVIGKLVEKYNLDKEIEEEEVVKKGLGDAKNYSEKDVVKFLFSKKINEQLKRGDKIEEILSSRKLIKIVGELIKNEISNEGLTAALQKSFGLPQESTEKLSKELQETIPILTAEETLDGDTLDGDTLEKERPIYEVPLADKENLQPKRKDIYKEKVE